MRFAISVCVVLLLLTTNAFSQDSLNVAKIGSLYDFWGFSLTVSYNDGYAYVPDIAAGIRVLDVSDVTNPAQITSFDTPAPVRVQLVGDVLYCLDVVAPGLLTFDVSDPVVAVPLDEYELYVSGSETRLTIDGNLAVVSEPETGVEFLDITDPANITQLSSFSAIPVGHTVVYGNYAYLAHSESNQFYVLDITNPSSPQFINVASGPWELDNWSIQGSYLYCASDGEGLLVYSLADPENPVQVTNYPTPDDCEALLVQDGYAYLGIQDYGFEIVDVSSPQSPAWVSTYTLGIGEIETIQLVGDYAFAAGGNPSLIIFNVADPADPSIAGSIGEGGWLDAIDIHGGIACITDETGRLHLADVSDPTAPAELAEVGPFESANHAVASDDFVYLATDDAEIYQFDVTDPTNPVLSGWIELNGDPFRMYERSDTLFVAVTDWNLDIGRLTVIDFTGTQPQIISETLLQGATYIHVDGPTAYLISYESNTVAIVDISDPDSPFVYCDIGGTGTPQSCVSYGDYLYIANGDEASFLILDVSVPGSPTVVNAVAIDGFVLSVRVTGDYLVVGTFGAGYLVYDLSNPVNPSLHGYYPGNSFDVFTEGDRVYSAELGRIAIYEIEAGTPDPVVLTLTPTSGTDLPAQGGTLVYSVHLQSSLPYSVSNLRYWTDVLLPNGTIYGPITTQTFNMPPFFDVTVQNRTQTVPPGAPAGTYSFRGHVGFFSGPEVNDAFTFTKAGATAGLDDGVGWIADGLILSGRLGISFDPPTRFHLAEAYPNPFNAMTTVRVMLPEASEMNVAVYNVAGQRVAELVNGQVEAGSHAFSFDAGHLASGLYFVRAMVPGQMNQTQKVMLVR